MLRGKTVLVLGAGSSVDFGMPVGALLADQLQKMLWISWDWDEVAEGDRILAHALRDFDRNNPGPLLDGARAVSRALPHFRSIDDCLGSHAHDPQMVRAGKTGIAHAISDAERSSFLRHLASPRAAEYESARQQLGKTWLRDLGHLLFTRLPRAKVEGVFDDLVVINFNYDRCLELALFGSLQGAYGLPEDEAAELVAKLRVFRPYGSLGRLKLGAGLRGVPFGPPPGHLSDLADQLRVYNEPAAETCDIEAMQSALGDAATIVMLGFACHPQNMTLLTVPPAKRVTTRATAIFATAYQESGPRIEGFTELIYAAFGSHPKIADAGCLPAKLLQDHSLRLSA